MRKIVFKHRRALGDALMFTAGVRDFKLLFPEIAINVDNNFPELWENNPYIDRSINKNQEGVEFYHVGYPNIQHSNSGFNHFTFSFLLDMIAQADGNKSLGISAGEFCSAWAGGRVGDGDPKLHETQEPFKSWRNRFQHLTNNGLKKYGDIHLSKNEAEFNMIESVYGISKYWVIAPGGKRDCTCKIWDWRRFQDVINHYDGLIKFVVIGKSDHLIERLDNVIDLTDKLKIREILPLVYHSEGCVAGVSFLMHLAAAMPPKFNRSRKPCVAIYGGREPISFTGYEGHQLLHSLGSLSCCDSGGCWQSRIVPLNKDKDKNGRLCHNTVIRDGRTIQQCMDTITSADVIRGIEKYYQGNLYNLSESRPVSFMHVIKPSEQNRSTVTSKEINVLASLSSKGGGEQSACEIVRLLRQAGWLVHFYPWDKVHSNYKSLDISEFSFKNGMVENMRTGLPLLFYANDQIWDFCDENSTRGLIDNSSSVVIGINYVNGNLPKAHWLSSSDKVKAVIFQNREKMDEFARDAIGFESTEKISMFGAISLDNFLELTLADRDKNKELVVLKHCTGDYRKYVTKESSKKGEKIHVWQKNIIKEDDIKFYTRLLKDIPKARFEFMEAHRELVDHFGNEPRMVFHNWNSMSVQDFLRRGHVYLYRSSNAWRDQYPRVVAEALAAGLPVLTEPRDGTYDRVIHGDTGFYCVDYDGFRYALKLLERKDGYRKSMGIKAKEWAKKNLDPKEWIRVLERIIYG